MAAPIIALAAATIGLGVFVDPLYRTAERAGEQLIDAEAYQRAVLGENYQRAVDGTLKELATVPDGSQTYEEDQP